MNNSAKSFILFCSLILMASVDNAARHMPPSPTVQPEFSPVFPDIVMIDTGNTKEYSGKMKMDKTCPKECVNRHGELMARALNDEISTLRFTREILVKHIVWDERDRSLPFLIDMAIQMKPKVISLSIAGDGISQEEYLSVKRATDNGILVVAASGNTYGKQPQYPSGYSLPCLIAVSTKEFGYRVESANMGEIYLERMSGERGTSFSTARSAAIALKYIEKYGSLSCQSIKKRMVEDFGSTQ